MHGLVNHMRSAHTKQSQVTKANARVQCDDCGHVVLGSQNLASHWRAAHSLPDKPMQSLEKPRVKQRFDCDSCSFNGTRRDIWHHWVRQHSCLSHSRLQQLLRHSKHPIACDVCLETLNHKLHLVSHLIKRHGMGLVPTRPRAKRLQRRGVCDDCGHQARQKDLPDHWRRRHADQ
jgi:predicted RNA-binding Zn-ribbon protein involved in translation (DUF1610 family)